MYIQDNKFSGEGWRLVMLVCLPTRHEASFRNLLQMGERDGETQTALWHCECVCGGVIF